MRKKTGPSNHAAPQESSLHPAAHQAVSQAPARASQGHCPSQHCPGREALAPAPWPNTAAPTALFWHCLTWCFTTRSPYPKGVSNSLIRYKDVSRQRSHVAMQALRHWKNAELKILALKSNTLSSCLEPSDVCYSCKQISKIYQFLFRKN